MSYQKKQRTRIEDLSADENELCELSEEMMMMIGGGYDGGGITLYPCKSTNEQCGGDVDVCSKYDEVC